MKQALVEELEDGAGDALGTSAARLALRAHLQATREPRHAARARESVRALCDDAHRRQLRAEQLLVAIKGAWHSLPEVEGAARVKPSDSSLDRFITLCIEEFYARRD